MCGEFNARTNQDNGKLSVLENCVRSGSDDPFLDRASHDLSLYEFGTRLLNLCDEMNCSILNGATRFRFENSETFVSPTGSSTIDYFILSNDLCNERILDSLTVDSSCVESDHLPVSLTIRLVRAKPQEHAPSAQTQWIEKLIWDNERVNTFLSELQSCAIQKQLHKVRCEIRKDIDKALQSCVDCIQAASSCW